MFKSWATWLGVENKKRQESETTVEVEEDEDGEVNKQREEDARLHTAKGFGGTFDEAKLNFYIVIRPNPEIVFLHILVHVGLDQTPQSGTRSSN